MIRHAFQLPVAAGLCLLVNCTLSGCGSSAGKGYERFIPSEETARASLERALRSWQEGQPPGPLPGKPTIELVDTVRHRGQRLREFTILGETPGNGPRVLAVRLALENPREETKVRYVVVGLDPLWVVRHEDYEMLAHWEHCPEDKDAAGKPWPRSNKGYRPCRMPPVGNVFLGAFAAGTSLAQPGWCWSGCASWSCS